MRIPLTFYSLMHQKLRTVVATAGVAAAVLLIFMQLGFLGSAERTATIFLSRLDYDLVLISRDYLDVNRPGDFPRSRLFQALAVDGTRQACPVYVSDNLWRVVKRHEDAPERKKKHGTRRPILMVGFNLADHVFLPTAIEGQVGRLKVPGAVLIDERTRDYFGDRGVGVETDLGTTRVEVVGEFTIGTGYGADGMLVMSEQTFLRVLGNARPDQVNLGLLKLKPGADSRAVADALRARLRADLPPGSRDEVRVLTRAEMERQERDFWVHKTSVGKIFYIGVVVALVVGFLFVYQVISGDIASRFREYATLKAIGYGDLALAGLVCRQAVLYGLLGYFPGLAASLALYEFVASRANVPIAMTWQRCLAVLGMALTLCVASGLLALGKVRSADPVDLF